MEFLPKPKEVKLLTGEHALCYDGRIVLEGRLLGNGDTYAKVLQKGIKKETGMQLISDTAFREEKRPARLYWNWMRQGKASSMCCR